MNRLINDFLCGTAVGGTASLGCIAYLFVRNRVRRNRGKRAYRSDLAGVNSGNRCAACGGFATRLYLNEHEDTWLCTNWHLCEMMQVYRGMLRDVESA